jgi:hypothetical protein
MATFYLDSSHNIINEISKYRRSIRYKAGKVDVYDNDSWFDTITRINIVALVTKLHTEIIEYAKKFNSDIDQAIHILGKATDLSTLAKGLIQTLKKIKIDINTSVNQVSPVSSKVLNSKHSDPQSGTTQDKVTPFMKNIAAMSKWTSEVVVPLYKLRQLRIILSYVKLDDLKKLGADTEKNATKLLTILAFGENLSIRYQDIGFRSVYINEFIKNWKQKTETSDAKNNDKLLEHAIKEAAIKTYAMKRVADLMQQRMDSIIPTSCIKCQADSITSLICTTCRCDEKGTSQIIVSLNQLPEKLLTELKCNSEKAILTNIDDIDLLKKELNSNFSYLKPSGNISTDNLEKLFKEITNIYSK